MKTTNVLTEAAALPAAWQSRIVGQVGPCKLKIIRMDEHGIETEVHPDYEEALLVLDGHMDMEIGSDRLSFATGDLCVVPAGVPHRVLPGSSGLLLLVDR